MRSSRDRPANPRAGPFQQPGSGPAIRWPQPAQPAPPFRRPWPGPGSTLGSQARAGPWVVTPLAPSPATAWGRAPTWGSDARAGLGPGIYGRVQQPLQRHGPPNRSEHRWADGAELNPDYRVVAVRPGLGSQGLGCAIPESPSSANLGGANPVPHYTGGSGSMRPPCRSPDLKARSAGTTLARGHQGPKTGITPEPPTDRGQRASFQSGERGPLRRRSLPGVPCQAPLGPPTGRRRFRLLASGSVQGLTREFWRPKPPEASRPNPQPSRLLVWM